MISIDLVIATYNRKKKINSQIKYLLDNKINFNEIIIVDSSDEINDFLFNNSHVKYFRSPRKNQPFQRYFGSKISKSDYILFMDDDVEFKNNLIVDELKIFLKNNNNLSGVSFDTIEKYKDSNISNLPKSIFPKSFMFFKNWITCYPNPKTGRFCSFAVRGNQVEKFNSTEIIRGHVFLVNRLKMFVNFNFELFNLFQNKVGMCEDGVIGYTLSKTGKILFFDSTSFVHNDQKDSTYSSDITKYAYKVSFSRLYINYEISRLNNNKYDFIKLKYIYHFLWRILGQLINIILSPNKIRYQFLKGTIYGFLNAAFNYNFKYISNSKFEQEINLFLKNNESK